MVKKTKRRGFRDGVNVEDIVTLTPEEKKLIRAQREFEKIKKGTWTYDIAIYCDEIRTNIRIHKASIGKRLWMIKSVQCEIERLKDQLKHGTITEKLPNSNLIMNEDEVNVMIARKEWAIQGEVLTIPTDFAKLRKNVGHLTIEQSIAMTEEEFNVYVDETKERIERLGYRFLG